MKRLLIAALAATTLSVGIGATPAAAQYHGGYYDRDYRDYRSDRYYDRRAEREYRRELRRQRAAERRYYRHQQRYGGYYDGGYYDNRGYYDRRSYRHSGYRRCDGGSGGAVIGAVVGGLAGRELATDRYRRGRGDRTAGAIIGAAVGAIAGSAIDRSDDRC